MDELFSVFETTGNAKSPTQSNDADDTNNENAQRSWNKKRNADGTLKNNGATATEDGDIELTDAPAGGDQDGDAGDGDKEDSGSSHLSDQQESKRQKKDKTDEPIMTDTFETAESRELTAAGGFAESDKDSGAIVLSHNIHHQVALPKDYPYIPLSQHKPPAEPARSYPFKLDPFQSMAVASIERDESVLVSAHTSAGKTVVAEYAIAQCLKRNQRVIYTSPIKALSNQKYRDFESIFGDVGLMTGDVTINPTASCLVMTTEILRSMLYRGSEIMREVGWVVFDEIHYMRDKTRGVVWEETIILLPKKVRYVFLSATIPNAFQFAEWIAKIHEQPCHVVYTDFRPTPLQNYFFPAGGKGIFLVVDEKGVFKENNFNEAMRTIEENINEPRSRDKKGKGKDRGRGSGASDQRAPITKVITNIMKRSYHPVIVFSFSKRECESLALNISNLRFTDDSEKEMVRKVFSSAIDSLPESDRELPQILHILPLLERGIGVHHSGLLPILKETIEILFQESLIKVLFATETFSIGLNMPAKTVVFTQVKKFDGVNTRPLTPSEYIQMSGRAGRRGLDSRGIVIMMVDDKMEPDVFKQIVVGQQDRLNSAFYLGYNMILNLLRIETFNPEYMLERCFFQFQTAASVPALQRELTELQQARDSVTVTDEATVKSYYNVRQQLNTYHQDMRLIIQIPSHCVHYLQPGRLIQIYDPRELSDDRLDGHDYGWGVVIDTMPRKRGNNNGSDSNIDQTSMVVDVLMPIAADSAQFAPSHPEHDMPPGIKSEALAADGNVRWEVVPCLFTCIKAISQVRVFLPKSGISSSRDKETVIKSVLEVKRRFPDGLPVMDPIENLEISDDGFKKLLRKIEVLESHLLSNPLHGSAVLPELWEQYHRKTKLSEQIKEKKRAIARAYDVAQLDELKSRKRVLRRLEFIDANEVVTLKARVACEISSTEGHELLLAELLFDGFFNELTPEVVAGVLSLFIFDEKLDADPLKDELAKPLRAVQAKARIIAKVSMESKIDTNEKDYVDSLKWQLMDTVHAWASGAKFLDICKMTTAYEGSLIRLFRRLEELLRQMAQAAKVMGSDDLTAKFEESLKRIRRDIVAAQSLYL